MKRKEQSYREENKDLKIIATLAKTENSDLKRTNIEKDLALLQLTLQLKNIKETVKGEEIAILKLKRQVKSIVELKTENTKLRSQVFVLEKQKKSIQELYCETTKELENALINPKIISVKSTQTDEHSDSLSDSLQEKDDNCSPLSTSKEEQCESNSNIIKSASCNINPSTYLNINISLEKNEREINEPVKMEIEDIAMSDSYAADIEDPWESEIIFGTASEQSLDDFLQEEADGNEKENNSNDKRSANDQTEVNELFKFVDNQTRNKPEKKEIEDIMMSDDDDAEDVEDHWESKIISDSVSELKDKDEEETIVNCKLCGNIFDGQNELIKHSKDMHVRSLVLCELCQKHFSSRSNLYLHNESQHKNRTFSCSFCAHKTLQKGNLKTHLYQNHCVENGTKEACSDSGIHKHGHRDRRRKKLRTSSDADLNMLSNLIEKVK